MILRTVEVHAAIQVILLSRYYRQYGKLVDIDCSISNYKEFIEAMNNEEVINVALIQDDKIGLSFINRLFTNFESGLSSPAIEVIKNKRSDYYKIGYNPAIESYELYKHRDNTRSSSFKTDKDLNDKIISIIEYYFQSSLLEGNDKSYAHFWGYPKQCLEAKNVQYYQPEFSEFISETDLKLLLALQISTGQGNMEMHNGLQGMAHSATEYYPDFLKHTKYSAFSVLLDLGEQFYYKLFR